ncbi:hypothetical protein SESBI_49736 [Sesbania bispinosa]|nr:hypothetical protein SESBI_49736 [Sesbania bispinosa]
MDCCDLPFSPANLVKAAMVTKRNVDLKRSLPETMAGNDGGSTRGIRRLEGDSSYDEDGRGGKRDGGIERMIVR